jgi:hypothetical protein
MPLSAHPTCAATTLLLAAILVFSAPPRAAAADPEVRDYVTYIDGKRAGDYRMTITTHDDGSVSMQGQARISVRIFVVTYRYNYGGTEVWKGGRLQQLESRTDDNGKRYAVSAVADADGVRVQVNNQPGRAPADAWVTTYWRLPEANLRNRNLTLLDADTGQVLNATLQYIGPSQVSVAGQVQNCTHWRVSGQAQVDLWYDARERLVRQEWVEDNHKAVLDLARARP